MSDIVDDRKARIMAVRDQLEAVQRVHVKLSRGEPLKETDAITVRRLIRMLVEEWV
jgi:hypothetical protein